MSLPTIRQLKRPVAIAMWDFSWLLRHPLGEFSDFDRVLDELSERGYDAVRIDAFPQLIAADEAGKITEEFFIPKQSWNCPIWGPAYSCFVRPRDALVEFLTKCRARGIRVGLSSWFLGHDANSRNRIFKGVDGFVRAWEETLAFLEERGLLHDVLYVDLLNEYPYWHEFTWLTEELGRLGNTPADSDSGLAANVWNVTEPFNDAQHAFHRGFMREVIARLAARWPRLDLFASLSYGSSIPMLEEIDFTGFGALDFHVWAVHHPTCSSATNYYTDMHPLKNDIGFVKCQDSISQWWKRDRTAILSWMDDQLGRVAEAGRKLGIPTGNTEGWGPVIWTEHPVLTWDFVKEAGDSCVELALKHGQKFICTSNFTHPQFPGLWKDAAWHQRLTSLIRKG